MSRKKSLANFRSRQVYVKYGARIRQLLQRTGQQLDYAGRTRSSACVQDAEWLWDSFEKTEEGLPILSLRFTWYQRCPSIRLQMKGILLCLDVEFMPPQGYTDISRAAQLSAIIQLGVALQRLANQPINLSVCGPFPLKTAQKVAQKERVLAHVFQPPVAPPDQVTFFLGESAGQIRRNRQRVRRDWRVLTHLGAA